MTKKRIGPPNELDQIDNANSFNFHQSGLPLATCQISSVGQGGQAGEVGQTDQVCPIGEGGACSLVGPG